VAPIAQLTSTRPRPASTAALPFDHPFLRPLHLWHLLSLDAPTVAALWTYFLAAADHIALPASSLLAMALAVWILYAADRLLDARLLGASSSSHRAADPWADDFWAADPELQPRHSFHHRHRRAFSTGIVLCALALAALLEELPAVAIRLDLALGAPLLAYFLVIHSPAPTPVPRSARPSTHVPKELAVGLFFAAAAFIPTVVRLPGVRPELLPSFLLFALLCSLNGLFIHAWEARESAAQFTKNSAQPQHPRPSQPRLHPATRLVLRHLRPLTLCTALTAVALAIAAKTTPTLLPPWPISAAIAIAALLLLLLDHLHRAHPLAPTTLRAAADLCLLTPLLFLPLLSA
jgi:hypothetical protein